MSTPLALGTAAISDWTAWTPVLSFATPGTSSFAYTTTTARYIKIGNLLIFDVNFTFTPTKGTGSGLLYMSLPPIAMGIGAYIFGGSPVDFSGGTWPTGRTVLTFRGATNIVIAAYGSGVSNGTVDATNLTNGAFHNLAGSGMYYTV